MSVRPAWVTHKQIQSQRVGVPFISVLWGTLCQFLNPQRRNSNEEILDHGENLHSTLGSTVGYLTAPKL